MLVYTNKTVDQDWLCIYRLLQNGKFSHFHRTGETERKNSKLLYTLEQHWMNDTYTQKIWIDGGGFFVLLFRKNS